MTKTTTADVNLLSKPLRDKWPIDAETKSKVVEELVGILSKTDATDRARVRAAEVLVKIGQVNASLEPKQRDVNVQVRIDERKRNLLNRVDGLLGHVSDN